MEIVKTFHVKFFPFGTGVPPRKVAVNQSFDKLLGFSVNPFSALMESYFNTLAILRTLIDLPMGWPITKDRRLQLAARIAPSAMLRPSLWISIP